jgi:4-hydroxy-tetrahydrodipicolinate reductase
MASSASRRTQKTQAVKLSGPPKASLSPTSIFKVGVFGAGGRMGHEILLSAPAILGDSCYLAVDSPEKKLNAKHVVTDLNDSKCKDVQVWIDFSSPEGFSKILTYCEKNKVPLVSGTTGLSTNQLKSLEKVTTPCLWSPNMSLGINIFLKALKSFRGAKGFDYQIEEAHHKHKKDKPSGTALLLQKELELVVGKKLETPLAIRGGGIFGIHRLWAMSEDETIIFEHQALNRAVFAKGSLQAALWLYDKKPGLYSLQNLLDDK